MVWGALSVLCAACVHAPVSAQPRPPRAGSCGAVGMPKPKWAAALDALAPREGMRTVEKRRRKLHASTCPPQRSKLHVPPALAPLCESVPCSSSHGMFGRRQRRPLRCGPPGGAQLCWGHHSTAGRAARRLPVQLPACGNSAAAAGGRWGSTRACHACKWVCEFASAPVLAQRRRRQLRRHRRCHGRAHGPAAGGPSALQEHHSLGYPWWGAPRATKMRGPGAGSQRVPGTPACLTNSLNSTPAASQGLKRAMAPVPLAPLQPRCCCLQAAATSMAGPSGGIHANGARSAGAG